MNGRIGIIKSDGTVRSVYLHWDPFPDTAGKILVENYTTEKSVMELVEKGDISSLGKDISGCKYYLDKQQSSSSGYETREDVSIDHLLESDGHKRAFIYVMMEGEWYFFTGDLSMYNLKEFLDDNQILIRTT
jgi:hypothetical protein